ncbi:MAG: FISUMP domain-containing protein [Bacteroidales bacterium]
MTHKIKIEIIVPLVSVILFTAGCEKESGLPVDVDRNVYDTVIIGTQMWMKENLKTTRYNNGVPIPYVADNEKWASITSAAYCWYNNNPVYKDNYGTLYNW